MNGKSPPGPHEPTNTLRKVPAEPEPAPVVVGTMSAPASPPPGNTAPPPPASDAPDKEVVLGNRYRLRAVIGKGGMGEVWVAEDLHLPGKEVAVKCISAEQIPADHEDVRRRFAAEVHATSQVKSSHVVHVIDQGAGPDGRPFFVMELLQGQDLKELLRVQKRLPVARALAIADQLLKGVGAAHAKGVVHRDLKPSNVMLVAEAHGEDMVKVLDFGIAKVLTDAAGGLTQEGMVMGTAGYMSPESAMDRVLPGEFPLVDLYAVGVILFEMLAGRRPFGGDSPAAEVREQLAADGVPRVSTTHPGIPGWLDAVLAKALAVHPRERYQSVEELRQTLRAEGEIAIEELPVGTLVENRYEIQGVIGRGGMGVVYLAVEPRLRRRCALKFLCVDRAVVKNWQRLEARFGHEGESLAKVDHPHVVRVYVAGIWRDHQFLALELVDGRSLRQCWSELGWPGFLRVVRQVAGALDVVHGAGVVHRDVTPENIVVDAAGNAKLVDFGIARDDGSPFTQSGWQEAIGRYGYKSPEQAVRPSGAPAASDQWSLAAIVYEALAGLPPFREPSDGDDPDDYSERLLARTPPRSPVSAQEGPAARMGEVVLRALSYDPMARFPTVTAFAAALEEAAPRDVALAAPSGDAAPVSTGPTPSPLAWSRPATGAHVRRGRRRYVFGATVIAAAAALVAWAPWRSGAGDGSADRVAASAAPAAAIDAGTASAGPDSSRSPPDQATAPLATPPSPAADLIRVTLVAQPRDAKAVIDGVRVSLPTTLERPRGTALTVLVERRGYVSETVVVTFEADGEKPVALVKTGGRRKDPPTRTESTKPAADRPLYLEPSKGDRDGVLGPK